MVITMHECDHCEGHGASENGEACSACNGEGAMSVADCPCGSHAWIVPVGDLYDLVKVECTSGLECWSGPRRSSSMSAVEAWNSALRRPTRTKPCATEKLLDRERRVEELARLAVEAKATIKDAIQHGVGSASVKRERDWLRRFEAVQ